MNVDEKDRTLVKAAEEQCKGISYSMLGSSDAAELSLYIDEVYCGALFCCVDIQI